MPTLDIILILPNQLFEKHDLIAKSSTNTRIIFYELDIYFTKYQYHKLRLAFMRAAFKNYADYIAKRYSRKVKYVNFNDDFAEIVIPKNIANFTQVNIQMYDCVDHDAEKWVRNKLMGFFPPDLKKEIKIHQTPMFLCSSADIKDYTDTLDRSKVNKSAMYKQTPFYIWQRKRLGLLIDADEKPLGGKWTFDKENRLPFPSAEHRSTKGQKSPKLPYDTVLPINTSKYVLDAIKYVEKWFPGNPGQLGSKSIYLPTDHSGAKKQFKRFLREKLDCFGPYQDASRPDVIFGCHTVISPLLNVGLLTPQWVVSELISYWEAKLRNTEQTTVKTTVNTAVDTRAHTAVKKGHKKQKLLESVEALLRQIIGWREMMRLLYIVEYPTMIRSNLFKHTKKLPAEWYANPFAGAKNTKYAQLRIITPVDNLLKKVWTVAYANHIERLMYLGGFMLLCEFSPQSIHDWFMCMFVDSYQWVMAANVYAMSQYATTMLMTKPYFSSSNYIMKMSAGSPSSPTSEPNSINNNSKNNKNYRWQDIWDSLYYAFIAKHKTMFAKNYATARGVYHWNQKSQSEKNKILKIASSYLENNKGVFGK